MIFDAKPTKNFKNILGKLGSDYTGKVIDGELCRYRKFNDLYDIEISGMNNNRVKNVSFDIYIWKLKPGKHIVDTYSAIKSVDELLEAIAIAEDKYLDLNE